MNHLVRKKFLTLLERTGLLWVSPKKRFGKNDQERFVILIYHRVSNTQKPDFLPASFNCPTFRFQEHLAVLKQHFSILPLEEASSLVREGRKLPPKSVVLTFDDCWYENQKTVVDPLVNLGMPATFFISTSEIDNEELHPNHHFYYLFDQVTLERLKEALQSLLSTPSKIFPVKTSPEAWRYWLESSLGYPLASGAGRLFLDKLERRLELPASPGLGKNLYMTSEQIRKLPTYGIQAGNHTVTHRQLTTLNEAGQRAELTEAQRVLSVLTGKPVKTLAYPYGGVDKFNAVSVKIAIELKHCCACTVIRGYNDTHTDPMRLQRINPIRLSGQELAFRLLWR